MYIVIALFAIGAAIYMTGALRQPESVEVITATVTRGNVEQLVSVSGVIEAEQSADLAFPTSGIVATVNVQEGDVVAAGDSLLTLQTSALQADRSDAVAALASAVATRDELAAGADTNTRTTNEQTVTLKETTLSTTEATQADLVANAYRTLLSTDLQAISIDDNEDATPPTVSGIYTCTEEGSYDIRVYASGADSGYSYQLSGLETGTYNASVVQPAAFGKCGLRLKFDESSRYNQTQWTIDIPNTNSGQYVTNRNNYALTQTQADGAITLAEQDLVLAEAAAQSSNAPARGEAIARANANIMSANARIARIDAQLADRTIRAPFSGTVTNIDILPGETVTTAPVVTVLAAGDFELTARIPEIDIGILEIGQTVRAVFDARSQDTLVGVVDFISLQATEIDGVAYYEAIITLEENPAWLRSGLNADIDIVVVEATDVLRVPRRFVTTADNETVITTLRGEATATTSVEVLLLGDDGYAAITGLNEGDTVVTE